MKFATQRQFSENSSVYFLKKNSSDRVFLSIQFLRGLAAVAVVILHAASLRTSANIDQTAFRLLNAGVDIFFVISGFVMVCSTRRMREPAKFLVSRLIRIAPLYWLGTALMAVELASAGKQPSLFELAASLFFIPYGDPSGDMQPVLQVGWTLSYEMFFYLAFALTLPLRPARQIVILSGFFFLLICLRPVLSGIGAIGLRFTSLTLIEFLFGCAIGLNIEWIHSFNIKIGLLLAIAGSSLIFVAIPFPQIPRAIAFGVPGALIVSGMLIMDRIFYRRAWSAFVMLGGASYSIYLFHVPMMMLVPLYSLDFLSFGASVLVLTVLSIAAGWVIHVGIERPLTRVLKSFWQTSRRSQP